MICLQLVPNPLLKQLSSIQIRNNIRLIQRRFELRASIILTRMHSNLYTLNRLKEHSQVGNEMEARYIIQGTKIALDAEEFQELLKSIDAQKLSPLGRSELPNQTIRAELVYVGLDDNYQLPSSCSSTNFMIKALWTVTAQMNTNTCLTQGYSNPMNLMRAGTQALLRIDQPLFVSLNLTFREVYPNA